MAKAHTPGNWSRKAKKKHPGTGAAALAVGLVLLVLLVGTAIGRYQHQFGSESYVRAKEFYFTSDFLDGKTHTLAPGSTEVEFTVGNHADELRFSEVDIDYTVTVSPKDGVTITPETGTLSEGSVNNGTLTISGLSSGKTYNVTVTGIGYADGKPNTPGYEKTLKATIEVLSEKSAVYKYLDATNPDYVLLTVWAQGYTGTVTIQPPEGMIPDNTDPVMGSVQTGAQFQDNESFSTSAYCSHTYRFFYNGSGVTADNFTVTYDGKNAEVKQPS